MNHRLDELLDIPTLILLPLITHTHLMYKSSLYS